MNKKSGRIRAIFRGRGWQLLVAAAAVLVVVLYVSFRESNGRTEYRTVPVSRGDITATVTASGTVNAVTTVLVGTQVSGTIKSISVDFNSPVRKGQVIAQIDPDMFQAQVEQARANAVKAAAQMRDAERTLKRNQELFARNLVPRSDLDTAETNYESFQAQHEQAKAALKVAETNLRYTRIVSPVDGVVISRSVDVGQTVAASFQTPTLFTIAQDLTRMQINTNIAEADIGSIKTDQDVEFHVDAYPDTPFRGKVRQIRRAPITVQNVVTYDVVVQVNNQDHQLMPGMTANVSIIIAIGKDVLRIPNTALRFRPADLGKGKQTAPPAQKKGPGVWILENGKLRRVEIVPGISDGVYTEIVSGDLTEGQELAIEAIKKNSSAPSAPRSGPRMF